MQVERSVVGRVIGGKYGIERVVGEGGCGVVVRAVHRGLGGDRAADDVDQLTPPPAEAARRRPGGAVAVKPRRGNRPAGSA